MARREFGSFETSLISSATEVLAEGVVLLDAEGRLRYVNRAFVEGVGLPREELLGRCFDDPIFVMKYPGGEHVPLEDRPFRRVIASGRGVVGEEYDLENVRGECIRVVLNAVPVAREGVLEGVAVTLTDITARAHTEDAFRQSEERLRAFVEQSRYGLFISDPSGDILLYNPAMEEITGHSLEEVLERGWLEASFPDPGKRALMAERARTSLAGELPYLEEQYERPDGTVIWLSYSVTPVNLQGHDYIAGFLTDITKRKQAEERIRFQSSLLDQVRNAVVASDTAGRITYMNEAAEQLYGWNAEEAIGRRVQDVLMPGRVDLEAMLRHVLETGTWEGESVMRRESGEEVPVVLTLALLRDAEGRPEGVVGVAVDVSEIKRVQRELEEKDRAIRQAYVDVVGAVTGGKLVLMTPEELSAVLGEQLLARAPVRPDTLAESRGRVREVMERERTASPPSEAVVAYGEAATNALKHAGGGHYSVFRTDHTLQVLVADEGPGIDFRTLPRATLMAGFSTGQTLGMGFTVMLDLSDRMLLVTQPGRTEVLLEFALR